MDIVTTIMGTQSRAQLPAPQQRPALGRLCLQQSPLRVTSIIPSIIGSKSTITISTQITITHRNSPPPPQPQRPHLDPPQAPTIGTTTTPTKRSRLWWLQRAPPTQIFDLPPTSPSLTCILIKLPPTKVKTIFSEQKL